MPQACSDLPSPLLPLAVNEEWFGISAPSQCANSIDALKPRKIYFDMRALWTGHSSQEHSFADCEQLITDHCIALGNGGTGRLRDVPKHYLGLDFSHGFSYSFAFLGRGPLDKPPPAHWPDMTPCALRAIHPPTYRQRHPPS